MTSIFSEFAHNSEFVIYFLVPTLFLFFVPCYVFRLREQITFDRGVLFPFTILKCMEMSRDMLHVSTVLYDVLRVEGYLKWL